MSGKIQGVHHIAVKPTAEKYEETIRFYTQVLGMEAVKSFGSPEMPIVMISCGDNSCLEIIPADKEFPSDGILAHVAFATDQVDEIVEAVREAGYPIKSEPHEINLNGMAVRNAFFYGPVGEEIELFWEK